MYEQIEANKRKTWILMFLFTVVIVLLGWAFGEYMGDPSIGIILAVIISVIMTLTGYFKGDKVALISAGAKQIQKKRRTRALSAC